MGKIHIQQDNKSLLLYSKQYFRALIPKVLLVSLFVGISLLFILVITFLDAPPTMSYWQLFFMKGFAILGAMFVLTLQFSWIAWILFREQILSIDHDNIRYSVNVIIPIHRWAMSVKKFKDAEFFVTKNGYGIVLADDSMTFRNIFFQPFYNTNKDYGKEMYDLQCMADVINNFCQSVHTTMPDTGQTDVNHYCGRWSITEQDDEIRLTRRGNVTRISSIILTGIAVFILECIALYFIFVGIQSQPPKDLSMIGFIILRIFSVPLSFMAIYMILMYFVVVFRPLVHYTIIISQSNIMYIKSFLLFKRKRHWVYDVHNIEMHRKKHSILSTFIDTGERDKPSLMLYYSLVFSDNLRNVIGIIDNLYYDESIHIAELAKIVHASKKKETLNSNSEIRP